MNRRRDFLVTSAASLAALASRPLAALAAPEPSRRQGGDGGERGLKKL